MAIGLRDIANQLARARLEGRQLTKPPGPDPSDIDEAYRIQDLVMETMGEPVTGWKVGATSKAAQDRMGVDAPICGPLYEPWTLEDGARILLPDHAIRIVEAEIAFRMGADLPIRDGFSSDGPYSDDELFAAIDTIHPALEIVDRRIGGGLEGDLRWTIADGSGNGAFIHGPGRQGMTVPALAAIEVVVFLDGTEAGRGKGANALGNPFDVLKWLVPHLATRGHQLHRGDWVSTGLLTPIFTADRGQHVKADFGPLGTVEGRIA